MAPNMHWTENESEQTFHALLEEGKLVGIEPGKYRLSGEKELSSDQVLKSQTLVILIIKLYP